MSAETKQEAQTWWRVDGFRFSVSPSEVVRVTEKTVAFLDGRDRRPRRENKSGSYAQWFDNESDAVEYVRSRLVSRAHTTRAAAERAASALAAFNETHPLPATEEA